MTASGAPGALVRSIGHSTHPLDEFVRLLRAHAVAHVVDVRTLPRSRRNPQFNRDTLPSALAAAGIGYTHLPGLGGLRRPQPHATANAGWENPSFRGYADYMQTPEFEQAVGALLREAERGAVALMCAEALPWRCHRSLIADALLARGVPVEHILSRTRATPHGFTPGAEVTGIQVTYPARRPPEPGLPRS